MEWNRKSSRVHTYSYLIVHPDGLSTRREHAVQGVQVGGMQVTAPVINCLQDHLTHAGGGISTHVERQQVPACERCSIVWAIRCSQCSFNNSLAGGHAKQRASAAR
jgi:hypothetical protein